MRRTLYFRPKVAGPRHSIIIHASSNKNNPTLSLNVPVLPREEGSVSAARLTAGIVLLLVSAAGCLVTWRRGNRSVKAKGRL